MIKAMVEEGDKIIHPADWDLTDEEMEEEVD
jgi:hypothetical protein